MFPVVESLHTDPEASEFTQDSTTGNISLKKILFLFQLWLLLGFFWENYWLYRLNESIESRVLKIMNSGDSTRMNGQVFSFVTNYQLIPEVGT